MLKNIQRICTPLVATSLLISSAALVTSPAFSIDAEQVFAEFKQELKKYEQNLHGRIDVQNEIHYFLYDKGQIDPDYESKFDVKSFEKQAIEYGMGILNKRLADKLVSKVKSVYLKKDLNINYSDPVLLFEETHSNEWQDTLDCVLYPRRNMDYPAIIKSTDVITITGVTLLTEFHTESRREGFDLNTDHPSVNHISCFQWGYGLSSAVAPNEASLSGDIDQGEVKILFDAVFSRLETGYQQR